MHHLLGQAAEERSRRLAASLEAEVVLHSEVVEDHLDLGLDLHQADRAAAAVQHRGQIHEVAEARAVDVADVPHEDRHERNAPVDGLVELFLEELGVRGVHASLDHHLRRAGKLEDRGDADGEVGHDGEMVAGDCQ